ncbi:MAG: AI-2E family transporter, partial [Spirochaeta sp.]|nr:AI-2E family transporter [Spirochaeta sp.]
DGPKFIDGIKALLPLADDDFERITNEAVRTAGATLRSTVVIGLGEGVFGAIMFLTFGLPAPFLWGMLMAVISMVPLIGTLSILVPGSIVLMLSGRLVAGLLMFGISFAAVSFSQNILKPMLLGDSSGMHPALVLLATFGGIAWLGLVGFILGPVIASLFVVVWRLFSRYYAGAEELHWNTRGQTAK